MGSSPVQRRRSDRMRGRAWRLYRVTGAVMVLALVVAHFIA